MCKIYGLSGLTKVIMLLPTLLFWMLERRLYYLRSGLPVDLTYTCYDFGISCLHVPHWFIGKIWNSSAWVPVKFHSLSAFLLFFLPRCSLTKPSSRPIAWQFLLLYIPFWFSEKNIIYPGLDDPELWKGLSCPNVCTVRVFLLVVPFFQLWVLVLDCTIFVWEGFSHQIAKSNLYKTKSNVGLGLMIFFYKYC